MHELPYRASDCPSGHRDVASQNRRHLRQLSQAEAAQLPRYFPRPSDRAWLRRHGAMLECHGVHLILPASNPKSKVARANLPATCGKCHLGVTASFVSYEPHPNPHDRRQNPALYYSAIFMNLLLLGVFLFFGLHTALWLVRSLIGGAPGPRRPPATSAKKDDGESR